LKEREIISESPMNKIYYEVLTPPVKARNLLTEKEIEKLLTELKITRLDICTL
jgi:hypothetical protein